MPGDVEVVRVDREAILELRAQVLGDPPTLSGDLAPATRHWAAVLDGAIVGCVSVMRLRGLALRGMAVALEHRRQGIGASMLRVVCAEVEADMWCNARIEAVPFYSHMGWVGVGPRFDLQDRGLHRRMIWTLPPVEGRLHRERSL